MSLEPDEGIRLSDEFMSLPGVIEELERSIVSLVVDFNELTVKLQQLEQAQKAQRNRAKEAARWTVIAFAGYAISSLPIRESLLPSWMATAIFFVAVIATGISLGKLWRTFDD